ncbi:hypothetical protein BBJ28_00001469 [Nothophytophthora sp. Chile5]|nr:hypothetical protein BBJ28_00001469 [Nothophytophthora sp. Chile5]
MSATSSEAKTGHGAAPPLLQQEAQWRRARQALYEQLERSAEGGLNSDAVQASRCPQQGRDPGGEILIRLDDAVTVVCAEIPRAAAQQWQGITTAVVAAVRGEPKGTGTRSDRVGTTAESVYVSDPDVMHVTLFYTSHPDDLAPRNPGERKADRIEREVTQLRELATKFAPFRVTPVKVVLAASGAILLLLQCLNIDNMDTHRDSQALEAVKNAGSHAEFSVDLLRQEAQEFFPFVSAKGPSTIVHATLARVLSVDAVDAAVLTRVQAVCKQLSAQLASDADSNALVVEQLWHVDESHYIRPTGHTSVVSLGPRETSRPTSKALSASR